MRGFLRALSPRRRALVLSVAGVLAVVAGTVIVAQLAGRTGSGDPPPADRPGPVVLVPGYGGGTGSLNVLAGRIRATGRTAVVVDPPGDGTGDLGRQARELDRRVGELLRTGAPSVDVIGYSAGGVVARLWAKDHDGARKARRIITLGSPHHGAELAAAGGALIPGACPTACEQLAPGSPLLNGLGNRVSSAPAWMSIWSTSDETVTPPDSARLDGATNVVLQTVCPGTRTSHSALPTDPAITTMVLNAIGPAPLTQPTRSACEQG